MPAIIAGGFLWKQTDLSPRRVRAVPKKDTRPPIEILGTKSSLASNEVNPSPLDVDGRPLRKGTSLLFE